MRVVVVLAMVVALVAVVSGELLKNTNMENKYNWDCWNFQCDLTSDRHGGSHGLLSSYRKNTYDGPSQWISVVRGHSYSASGFIKLTIDLSHGQDLQLEVDFEFSDGSHEYVTAASRSNMRTSNGWVHLSGNFDVPNKPLAKARIYFQGPQPGCNFVVDDASVTERSGGGGGGTHTQQSTNSNIDKLRKSDINIRVSTSGSVNKNDVKIRVVQKKKAFPFGTAVNAGRYNDQHLGGYRDFIHKHFNWAVPENALKWPSIEPNRGQKNYQPALDMIHGLKSHGLKVRGHNLVWSVDQWVQGWIKQLSGNTLRTVVQQHIQETMGKTKGLLEHWDVNNENLHGWWFQTRLGDNDYNLELFRIAHKTDSHVKLFLNDYNVVANSGSTNDYLKQAQWFKQSNVGLYGVGCQGHFGNEEDPNPDGIKQRLDTLAHAGLPIWITELDVQAQDENKRADFYERALTAMYGHHAVEGILIWGFWDQQHWRGAKASLVDGSNFHVNAAGRRVIDLLENRWMTDETHTLSSSGDHFTVRGFHGDYELHVLYQGHDLGNLKKTFSLGKSAHTETVNIHV
ncbi:anti-sigma-I factor RsgI6-like [Littorina saxatilis]|uniref:anti-sigma-I factor RsgI6-like n=1 Tax=Littorina saxatilis TaxID=31220 RepID=UPI0038B4BFE6